MRPGWNPVRRNRNIGTDAQGYGKDNELVIPGSWRNLKRYFEQLTHCTNFTRRVGTRDIQFIVEQPHEGWFYPCTPDDVCEVLRHCPEEDLETVDLIVFRQATRKQRVLSPVWGRAVWYAEIRRWKGSAIVLETQNIEPILWPKSLNPDSSRELERLNSDGHRVVTGKRNIQIHVTPESLRNTVLYRTVLHELGHHVDFNRTNLDAWRSRPQIEKEDFAHRYATNTFTRLKRTGLVPFPRILHPRSLKREGMAKTWFTEK